MNIGLFGGTFDPIHRGHLKVARAAADRFKLREVWFIPVDISPHKQKSPPTSYFHRYSMVALAVADEPEFLASLLEAPEPGAHMERQPSYTINTIRQVKARLRRRDRVFFLVGIDAFRDIAKWHKSVELLRECDFIVAARPGHSLENLAQWLPKELRPTSKEVQALGRDEALHNYGVKLHLLPETHENVSATQIRAAMRNGKALKKFVPDTVAEYIRKEGLYRTAVASRQLPVNRRRAS
jgi:nicotinate-nucleotide adenylyltransferase